MAESPEMNLGEMIRRQLALRAAMEDNPRYSPDAYIFVCEGVNYTCAKLGGRRDVSGRELCVGLCELALEQFGFLAPTVLRHWGVTRTEDFGEIVFTLVEHGLLGKSQQDSRADFENLFDLQQTLRERYRMDDGETD